MAKTNTKIYTQKEFENDLNKLESLVKKNNKNDNENYEDENDDDNENYEEEEEEYQYGGKEEYKGIYRRFKVVQLDGKPVKFEGRAEIKEHHTPVSAAKKLLRSIAAEKNLTGSNKLKLHPVIFSIQETTRESKHKVYGPYHGRYKKYTPEEMKKAKVDGRKYEMKAVVKLYKKKDHNEENKKNEKAHKGGFQL
jgi:hypothetical protein